MQGRGGSSDGNDPMDWQIGIRGTSAWIDDDTVPGGGIGGSSLLSDDERSIAGDSWSVKSEYGSTLDGDEGGRAADVMVGLILSDNSGAGPSSIPDVDDRIAGVSGITLAVSREHICPPVSEEQAFGEEQDEDCRQDRQEGGSMGEDTRSQAHPDDREHPSGEEEVGGEREGEPDARDIIGPNDAILEQQRPSGVVCGEGTAKPSPFLKEAGGDEREGTEGRDALIDEHGSASVVQQEEGTPIEAAASEGTEVEQAEGDEGKKLEREKEKAERVGETNAGEQEEEQEQGGERRDENASNDKVGEGEGDRVDGKDDGGKDAETKEENVGEAEDEEEEEVSVLGLHCHWESTYEEELETFQECGDVGEIWFGERVMDTCARWTAQLAASVAASPDTSPDAFAPAAAAAASGSAAPSSGSSLPPTNGRSSTDGSGGLAGAAASWRVLDVGTGNGMLLHALAEHGFSDLTGTDYSEKGVELANTIAHKLNRPHIKFVMDDVLSTSLSSPFHLVTDKGTFDAIGLHAEGQTRKQQYKKAVLHLLPPRGLLVITSCNSTAEELATEFTALLPSTSDDGGSNSSAADGPPEPVWKLLEVGRVASYPTFTFGGVQGARVATVAFQKVPCTSDNVQVGQ